MRFWRFIVAQSFSSLTRRIVLLNVAGLLALFIGILYLSQFRAGLIEARVRSLGVQAEIIAGAIAASATVETDSITIDPEKLLELQTGESYGPPDDFLSAFEFPINPERVAPVLRRLISPTNTRARIYDRDGVLVLDSRSLYGRGDVLRFDLPPPNAEKPGFIEKQWNSIRKWLGRGDLPLYIELGPDNGKGYPEVAQALAGQKASVVRINARGEVIVSVATPVQRFRAVRGALLLSTQGADIDQMVEAERLAIFKVFLVMAAVMIVLSILLAGTIAGPVRRLADGADRVRRRIRSRVEIPDFTRRGDEIGHLSGALRDMTNALYSRIEGIESFAADVAHELKNPLTSLRSAVETLPLVKTRESQERLLAVIQHDVQRLDRLISDISDASRLDAELQRQEAEAVDLRQLLTTLVEAANEVPHDGTRVALSFEGAGAKAFVVPGHDSRLAQVVDNLVQNARSFSPPGATVSITARRLKNELEIIVDDEGPGIRPEAFEKIFERFYTDRPHQGFGQNSGLGLSISKQIVDAHGGRLWAENRLGVAAHEGAEPNVLGARFVVRLPAM
ncbi:MAG: HAMP domain-containing histidine kinase [Pseudorhodoplanes sp.]|nr:HAMP domain-containing histidine kinase [Pseudorhodoplanes sp.]